MNRRLVLALLAACVFAISRANAIPNFDPGDVGDVGTVEDPCLQHPQLCDPVDPCELHPDQCDPPDPCELAPATCDGDPPLADPGDAPSFPSAVILTGVAKLRGDGFATSQSFQLFMVFGDTAFSAFDDRGQSYAGRLAPKGRSGAKLQIFLDAASSDGLSAQIAGRAADASGRSAGAVLGESSKLVLKLRPDGSASLKIKSQVLVGDLGEVSFKASLVGPVSVD